MVTSSSTSPLLQVIDDNLTSIRSSKPCIVGDETLCYGDVFDRLTRLSSYFRSIGLSCGDRVLLISHDDAATVTLFLALLRNGVTSVVVDPAATVDEICNMIEAADAKAIFGDRAVLEEPDITSRTHNMARLCVAARKRGRPSVLRRLGGRKVVNDQPGTNGGGDEYPAVLTSVTATTGLPTDIPESTTAYILFTSGTTSLPKGVEITHRNLYAQMSTFVRHYGLDADTRLLNVLPLHHTDGLTQGVFVTFFAGATCFRRWRFRVDLLPRLLDSIYTDRITHFVTVPSVLSLIVNLGKDFQNSFATEDFRFLISTAAYLDTNIWRDFETMFGVMVVNVYGLTETVCESLYCGPSVDSRKIGTVGKPIDAEARIVDEYGQDVPVGTVGELVLCGDHIMKGYFRRPAETAEVLQNGWFHTGDLACCDEDGFYHIKGRKKNVIITAGVNVYPEDVNCVLREVPGVLDAVTFGKQDDMWGELVVSCVVPSPGSDLHVEQISAEFLKKASRQKLPREIHIVNELPRGPAGKVILSEVKQMAARDTEMARTHEDAGHLASRVLGVAAWAFKEPQALLRPESSSENTKGWNSLAHVEFLLALEKEFHIRISPHDIMNIVTIGDAIRIVTHKLEFSVVR